MIINVAPKTASPPANPRDQASHLNITLVVWTGVGASGVAQRVSKSK